MKQKLLITALLILLIFLIGINRAFPKIIKLTHQLPRNGEYPKRDLTQISEIVIHHSAADGQTAWDYARYHTETRDWPGIGYHYVIDPDGTINQTNHLTSISNHVSGANSRAVGICLSGDLDSHPMSSQQQRSVKRLIRSLQIKLPNQLQIKAHKDYSSTSCPGSHTDISQFQ